VLCVNTLFGDVFGNLLEQMTDVMQQRGDHQVRGRVFLLREMSRLQGVLHLRDGFSEIRIGPALISAGAEILMLTRKID
jgi:hypothetical protein